MVEWKSLKRMFRHQQSSKPPARNFVWVGATENPWGVRVLDVRPVTQNMVSMSPVQQHAINALSFGQDDGTSFIGKEPSTTRIVESHLRFPLDRLLAEGALFLRHSWGGRLSGIALAAAARFRAAVLYVAGFRFPKSMPEVDPFNFVHRVRIPVLMLNGRYDHYFRSKPPRSRCS